jgi:hypothetical protein
MAGWPEARERESDLGAATPVRLGHCRAKSLLRNCRIQPLFCRRPCGSDFRPQPAGIPSLRWCPGRTTRDGRASQAGMPATPSGRSSGGTSTSRSTTTPPFPPKARAGAKLGARLANRPGNEGRGPPVPSDPNDGAAEGMREDLCLGVPQGLPPGTGIGHRHPHHEHETGLNKIPDRAPDPSGVVGLVRQEFPGPSRHPASDLAERESGRAHHQHDQATEGVQRLQARGGD